jgi:hypothetical protein
MCFIIIVILSKQTSTAIHFIFNRSMECKFSAYIFLINRVYQLPLTPQRQLLEQNAIKRISRHGFPINLMHLNTRMKITSIQQPLIMKNVDSAIPGFHLHTKEPPQPENHSYVKRQRPKNRLSIFK